MSVQFTISLEPLNEPDRKHWCDVGGCQAQVLFADEDRWVCWLHGQGKLREDRDWWTHELLTAVAAPPEPPPPPKVWPEEHVKMLHQIAAENLDVSPLLELGYRYSEIGSKLEEL